MKGLNLILCLFIIGSCSKIPAPSFLSPSESSSLQKVSFGESPNNNYQKILKDYLVNNMNSYKRARVEFINSPSKISIDHLGDTYSGYRVCLSINEKKGDYYRGYKNHFFLINNDKVILHLYDSGLLVIPFEYCVTRNIKNEFFVEDIPEEKYTEIENMDNSELIEKKENEIEIAKIDQQSHNINTYILCNIDNIEYTYIFNEKSKNFAMVNGLKKVDYQVSFNEAYIVATLEDIEVTINRVSGKLVESYDNKSKSGSCELLDKTKF
jgi:hypothetical protein